jgi:hypothetical protein
METVFDGENRYFLQYHRGRDFTPATFILERNLEEGEIEADFVRGITGPEGIIGETGMWYVDGGLSGELPNEEASFDFHFNYIFSELMAPRRNLQFLVANDFSHLALKTVDMHMQKSKLFKPQVSVFIEEDKIEKVFSEIDINNTEKTLRSFGVQGFSEIKVKMFVISDGRKAFVKRLR